MTDRSCRSGLSVLAAASERPDDAAIITPTGSLSYGELAARVRRTMEWVRRGSPRVVAVVATLRVETLVALFAMFELGIPVAAIHPRATRAERAAAVAAVEATLVLDESWTDESLDVSLDASPLAVVNEGDGPPNDALLAILFTSGTSGTPKGVALSRRALCAAAAASAENLGWLPEDRWLLCMPLGHVGGLSVVVRCLIARRPVVMFPWTGSVEALLAAIAHHRVTLLSFVPTMLRRVFDDAPDYRFPSHVRAVLLGGDASSPTLLAEAARRNVPVLTTYGLSEACAQVATQRLGERPSPDAGVGRPLRGVEVRIVDGEIQVRGATLMTGYFGGKSGSSPFVDDGWFPTGDLGEIDADGRLHVRGRKSDRLITGGENVDPLEVERVLVTCPGVGSACVFGVPDERWGQTIAAAIIPADPAAPPSPAAMAEHLRDRLAGFKQPRAYAVCSSFVLNASSKVDRARTATAVADLLAAGRVRVKT